MRTKRFFDVLVSLIGLTVAAPLLIVVASMVFFTMGAPIFFRQQRPGFNGKPFELLKFRTMSMACNEAGQLKPDAQRLTVVGSFLRSTSLDELPELWNILKGEMSLVGPRPLLMDYLPLYSQQQMRRHEVRPGLTGWAQINGRNSLSWEERFQMDLWYIDHRSLWLDLKIMGLTLFKVLRQDGVRQQGHVTMERFQGSNK